MILVATKLGMRIEQPFESWFACLDRAAQLQEAGWETIVVHRDHQGRRVLAAVWPR